MSRTIAIALMLLAVAASPSMSQGGSWLYSPPQNSANLQKIDEHLTYDEANGWLSSDVDVRGEAGTSVLFDYAANNNNSSSITLSNGAKLSTGKFFTLENGSGLIIANSNSGFIANEADVRLNFLVSGAELYTNYLDFDNTRASFQYLYARSNAYLTNVTDLGGSGAVVFPHGAASDSWTDISGAGINVNADLNVPSGYQATFVDGWIQQPEEATISGGAVAVPPRTRTFMSVDTESGSALDQLDSLGNCTVGQEVKFTMINAAHVIEIRDVSVSGGNIQTPGDATITLASGVVREAVCYGTNYWSVMP